MINLSPYVPAAQKIQGETGIPASVLLAQLINESVSGNHLSGLASSANNLFGIKGSGDAGSVTMPTTEYVHGQRVTVNASFARYSSPYASMQAYAKLLSNPRYATHLKSAKSVNDYVNGIVAGGYATDPAYAKKVLNIIQQDGLHQYDKGSIAFKPVSGGSSGSDSGGAAAQDHGIVGTVFYGAVRTVFILGLFIGAFIFLIQAFPQLQEAANSTIKKGAKVAATAALV